LSRKERWKNDRFRIWTPFLKELRQIKADKKLVVSLILPPTLQLVIFGFAVALVGVSAWRFRKQLG
jgi:hypothetical protein